MVQTLILKSNGAIIEIDGYFDEDNYMPVEINTSETYLPLWITTEQAKEIITHLTTCLEEHEQSKNK